MADTLADILRHHLVEARIENARFTHDHSNPTERAAEARRQVYEVMYESALGRMTAEERQTILDILRPCCPDLFESGQQLLPPPPAFSGLDDPWAGA